ncbi:MAG: molecular chaperone DnaJ [Planctomycetales bacterium 12-60-4]|nr:MAG: molecular chaperone DnaJ [Planctomycetales bacterium 12-60-4]
MADSDFYKTLGVARNASADEIRKAYRKLARENHPDAKKDDPAAAELFKQVQEAYAVLSDPEKREQYDRYGAAFHQAGRTPGGKGGPGGQTYSWSSSGAPGGGFDFNDLFGRSFDFEEVLGGGRRGRGGARPPARGTDLEAEVRVSFETAATGGSVDIQLEAGGTSQTLAVKIPAGVDTGSVIRLAGQGQPGRFNGSAGDLLLTVQVEPHRYFRREGANLLVDVPITPSEAVLGAKVEVPTLTEGAVVLTIPPGTSSGMKLRLRGKGIVDPQSKQPGDQFVVVKIVVPRDADDETKTLYRQIAEKEASPRTGLWS